MSRGTIATLLTVFGWLSIAGGLLLAVLSAVGGAIVPGVIWLGEGLFAAVPLFGLGLLLRGLDQQEETMGELRGDVASLRTALKAQPVNTPEPARAPMAAPPKPVIEGPKLDLSKIAER